MRDVGFSAMKVPPHKRLSRGDPDIELHRTSLCGRRRVRQELQNTQLAGYLAAAISRWCQWMVARQEPSPQVMPLDDISRPDDVVSMLDGLSPAIDHNNNKCS